MTLVQLLETHHKQIRDHLYCSPDQWTAFLRLIDGREAQDRPLNAEKPWTFLLSSGYALAGEKGIQKLTALLTGSEQPQPATPKIWLEGMCIPPRRGEGPTHVDLALGAVQKRGESQSGIEFGDRQGTWVCFCEMKWRSDASQQVQNDPSRHQLTRDIENALCFQRTGLFPAAVYFMIVAPSAFDSLYPSLLQKLEEYWKNTDNLVSDLRKCRLETNGRPDWHYPKDIETRVKSLQGLGLHNTAALIHHLPDSEISEEIQAWWEMEGIN